MSYGMLQGADAPAQLSFVVEADTRETGSWAQKRYESHAEDLGLSVIGVRYVGHDTPDDPTEIMVEGTLAKLGALLDAFTADEASYEGDLFLYLTHAPSDSAKPLEYENAALDAIRERHHWKNGGFLVGILSRVSPAT